MHIGIKLNETGCGWAVTDDDFHVCHKKGKALIGAEIFGKADTAEERRIKRGEKRRKTAQKRRIHFIDDIFNVELEKEYPGFMESVKNAGLKDNKTPDISLPKMPQFDYSDKYPTIHHARAAVKDGQETDLRIIYLLVLYAMKHRGHFMYKTGTSASDVKNINFCYAAYKHCLAEIGISFPDDKESIQSLSDILLSKDSLKEKTKTIKGLFRIDNKDKMASAAITMMLGGTVDLRTFFADSFEDAEKDDSKVKFSDGMEWEETRLRLEAYLSADELALVDTARAVYDWTQMKQLLGNARTFTEAYINAYDTHKQDLKQLKQLCKQLKAYDNKIYDDIFFDKEQKNGYAAYIGKGYNPKNQGHFTCSKEDFYAFIKKRLLAVKEKTGSFDAQIDEILGKMDASNFLPKQKTTSNRLVPNVLLAEELGKVLSVAAAKYDFLNKIGISGSLMVKDEILEMFSFIMPSWIGPLDDDQFGWAVWKKGVKREPQDVYPWNLQDKIDFGQTRKNYIRSLTNDCAYIANAKVLPDNSYYVRKAQVLNELNAITIDGERLSVMAKQLIFNELSMVYEKVTQKNIEKFLEEKGLLDSSLSHEFTGFVKKKLVHTMAPYIRAKAVKPEITVKEYESVALATTVCGSERELMYEIIRADTDLSDDLIKTLCNVVKVSSTNPWSCWSETFLMQMPGHKNDDPGSLDKHIIGMLYDSQARLPELLGSDYTFADTITQYNTSNAAAVSLKEFINGINTPTYIRRSFFQLAAVLKDIRNFCKGDVIDTVCINLYAPNNFKAKHVNIRTVLLKGLTALKETELISRLKTEEMPLSKKKALWYAQLGCDIYTGEIIPYEQLMSKEWTVDHIYPKSKIYDKEISNLVLTSETENKEKGNKYPVDPAIIEDRKEYWDMLLSAGLMTQKKYDALTSLSGIPIEKKLESIDKLLIEHRKTASYGAYGIIKRILPDVKVIFVDDNRLNDFKGKYGLYESDTINYLHYAKDALYTTIVGRVWDNIFTAHPKHYIMANPDYSLNVWNYDSALWNADKGMYGLSPDNCIPLFTKATTSNTTGAFADASIYSAKHMQSVDCPVMSKGKPDSKDADTTLYGGRKSVNTAYYCIISTRKKSERQTTIASVPTYMVDKIRTKEDLLAYLQTKYDDPVILREKVMLYSLLELDGVLYQIRGISHKGVLRLALAEPFWIPMAERYETVFKAAALQKNEKRFMAFAEKNHITAEENMQLYDLFLQEYEKKYSHRRNNALDKLIAHRTDFKGLTLIQQCIVLKNIFGLTASGSTSAADLTLLGEAAQTGVISVNINSVSSFTLVEQSATGLYEKRTTY